MIRVEQILEASGTSVAPPPRVRTSAPATSHPVKDHSARIRQEDQEESEESSTDSSGHHEGGNSIRGGGAGDSDGEDIEMKKLTVSDYEVRSIIIREIC